MSQAVRTTTISEFLLARIAEDEASLPSGFDCWYDPQRYAAECKAKRAIVEMHSPPTAWRGEPYDGEPDGTLYEPEPYQSDQCATCGYAEAWEVEENGPTYPCHTIKALATVYADHDDYRAEWAL